MDYEWIKVGILSLSVISNIVLWLVNARDLKERATISSINRIETNLGDKITASETRLTVLEQNAHNAPTHQDLGKVYDEIRLMNNKLSGEVQSVSNGMSKLLGEFTQVSRALDRLYDNTLGIKQ